MQTLSTPLTKEEKHAHNEIAALLSIVPGLGTHLQRPLRDGSSLDVPRNADSPYSSASYLSLALQVSVYSSQSGAGQLLRMMPTMKKTGVIIII